MTAPSSTGGAKRPWLCRIGLHRWRILRAGVYIALCWERQCSRCGYAERVTVYP